MFNRTKKIIQVWNNIVVNNDRIVYVNVLSKKKSLDNFIFLQQQLTEIDNNFLCAHLQMINVRLQIHTELREKYCVMNPPLQSP